MWNPFKCRFFRDHDYAMRREPGAMFLECRRCGHRSNGWVLDQKRTRPVHSPLRLFIAEPSTATHAIPMMHGSEAVDTPRDAAGLRLTFGEFPRERFSQTSTLRSLAES